MKDIHKQRLNAIKREHPHDVPLDALSQVLWRAALAEVEETIEREDAAEQCAPQYGPRRAVPGDIV